MRLAANFHNFYYYAHAPASFIMGDRLSFSVEESKEIARNPLILHHLWL
jgi:hypothetical protein